MGVVTGGGGGTSTVLSHTTTLLAADILALDTTPVTLVAGVSGSAIVPTQYGFVLHPGSNGYTDASSFRFFVGTTFGSAGWGASVSGNGNFAGTTPLAFFQTLDSNNLALDREALTLLDGKPLRMDEPSVPTGGNGTAAVTVVYWLLAVT